MDCSQSFLTNIICIVVGGVLALIPTIINLFSSFRQHKKQTIYNKQIEKLSTLYEKVTISSMDIETYMNPLSRTDKEELKKKSELAQESFRDMASFFYKNKIFFPNNIAKDVEKLINSMWKKAASFEFAYNYDGKQEMNKLWEEQKNWHIAVILKAIEAEIKSHIGLKDKDDHGED